VAASKPLQVKKIGSYFCCQIPLCSDLAQKHAHHQSHYKEQDRKVKNRFNHIVANARHTCRNICFQKREIVGRKNLLAQWLFGRFVQAACHFERI